MLLQLMWCRRRCLKCNAAMSPKHAVRVRPKSGASTTAARLVRCLSAAPTRRRARSARLVRLHLPRRAARSSTQEHAAARRSTQHAAAARSTRSTRTAQSTSLRTRRRTVHGRRPRAARMAAAAARRTRSLAAPTPAPTPLSPRWIGASEYNCLLTLLPELSTDRLRCSCWPVESWYEETERAG
jgi:hypothetical protein